jgi:hypothetical protein
MEETSYQPVANQQPKYRNKRRATGIVLCFLLLLVASGGFLLYMSQTKNSISPTIVKTAEFPIYYPASVPAGYELDSNFTRLSSGILFYKLHNGADTISVTEEALPQNPPDLASIPGFNQLSTDAGNAIAGTYNKTPTVVITNNATLITITGSNNVPYDIVVAIAQAMHSLSR